MTNVVTDGTRMSSNATAPGSALTQEARINVLALHLDRIRQMIGWQDGKDGKPPTIAWTRMWHTEEGKALALMHLQALEIAVHGEIRTPYPSAHHA